MDTRRVVSGPDDGRLSYLAGGEDLNSMEVVAPARQA
jgi:hypothetical protein